MSASIDLRLACGCGASLGSDGNVIPCVAHRVSRVVFVTAPAPRIRGTASGPHVTTIELEPIKVNFNG